MFEVQVFLCASFTEQASNVSDCKYGNWKILLEVYSFIQRFEAVVFLFHLNKDFFFNFFFFN